MAKSTLTSIRVAARRFAMRNALRALMPRTRAPRASAARPLRRLARETRESARAALGGALCPRAADAHIRLGGSGVSERGRGEQRQRRTPRLIERRRGRVPIAFLSDGRAASSVRQRTWCARCASCWPATAAWEARPTSSARSCSRPSIDADAARSAATERAATRDERDQREAQQRSTVAPRKRHR